MKTEKFYNLLKTKIDLGEIPQKIYKILEKSGWSTKLRGFLYSEDFLKILAYLVKTVDEDTRFTPPLNRMLRAFEMCPVGNLKVVMIGHGPSPHLHQAAGYLFGNETGKPDPVLREILAEVGRTVYPDNRKYKGSPDLTRWSEQGVLLLHSALTTQVERYGTHYQLWEPFIEYVLDVLRRDKDLVWVLVGGRGARYEDTIDNDEMILKVSNPHASTRIRQSWNSGDLFNRINQLLTEKTRLPIVW